MQNLEAAPQELMALGQRAFRAGDMQGARSAFARLAQLDGSDPRQWVNLALACRNLEDEPAEEAAIQRALTVDPLDLIALIMRADLLERQGKRHQAAAAHAAVTAVAPPIDRLHPDLHAAVARAWKYKQDYDDDLGAYLTERLEPHFRELADEDLRRFRDSLDIMVGKKRRYESRSELYHYPHLPAIEAFEGAQFPWLDAIEAATGDIREEFLGVLRAEEGFTPYISYPNDVPLNQWVELNNSPRWSAFHLWNLGKEVAENVAKCPVTMKALGHAPQPDLPGRTPSAMFSLLKPKTRIPPHHGVTNVRLVTHLPLIVPESCGFRVGNDVREWIPGNAFVFDDTIEHEAWNESEKLRVVLIFDIWHPLLSAAERAMITALTGGLNAFVGDAGAPASGL